MADKKEPKKPENLDKVTVRANDTVIKKKGAFHDPALTGEVDKKGKRVRVNPKAIGEEPIEVFRTPFVAQRLRSGDLVEVR